jgi:uncharacterized membrane protein
MSTIVNIIVLIVIFYALIILFLHKASVHFHKMDEKVGNIESAESPSGKSSRMNDNISDEKKKMKKRKSKRTRKSIKSERAEV